MIRYIFTLILVFASTAFAFSQTNTCVQEDRCFRLEYLGATENDNNTFRLTYALQVNCNTPLNYIAFELPEDSKAATPANIYATNTRYNVYNGRTSGSKLNTDFNSIQFNTKPRIVIRNGMTDTLEFYLTAEDFASLGTMRVQTQAGPNLSVLTFDVAGCGMAPIFPTACTLELDEMIFGAAGTEDNGDGTSTVWVTVRNNTPNEVQRVTITSPNTAVTVQPATQGASYNGKYKYKVSAEGSSITFEAQNTTGYANMMQDIFGFVVPTAAQDTEPVYLIEVETTEATVATGFNTESCEDQPIVPLPVELVSFTGKATQSGIELNWSTASEQDNDRFEIEHSADARSFKQIGTVQGVGTTTLTQHYRFETAYLPQGVHYFRLRQVDFDGTFDISKTIAVQVRQNPLTAAGMALYPNPTVGQHLTVALPEPVGTQGAQVQILNMNGRAVHTALLNPGDISIRLSIPDLQLTKGMYMVRVQHGSEVETKKLLIQ